ncbi:SRPBCC domain-containing protein [Lysinibacillus sp. Ag94]|uniref:SRPBCC family protein n=1 Tax=Lysinibacillus sp. Ag94 TaxID=2936682 RepID=UPI00200FB772|nr:SRPBCC domain-containing protein [Lysinibacillus sp. Ag94]UPW85195.1 SRPBCC domain-containing protein [Lysinibacillus sp. Ag94]
MDTKRIIGQTKTVGFQVGIRRTFPISQEKAWELIASEDGLKLWLGESTKINLQPGQKFRTKIGEGEIRIVKPQQQLRLAWKKEGWDKTSTIQVRIIPKENTKTIISFHQENLSDQNVREEMQQYWETILKQIEEWIN